MQRATITGANSTSKDFIVRYRVFLLAAVASISSSLYAQTPAWQPAPGHTTISIWPHAAPGAPPNPGPEIDTTTAKDNLIAGKPLMRLGNVSSPTLTLYTPAGNNTGAAVVVFPGGGYRILAIDLEGTEVCEWLNSAGITCVLLKYRVPESGPYPKSSAALQDAQRALGIVRSHAAEWHIDPHRIGVLGFSAGAHLAAALSTHFEQRLYDPVDAADQVSCRPDFAVIVYPGYLALEEQNLAPNADIHVSDKTPPSFIVQAEDDPVHVENATVYFQALKNAKVPAELHIYAEGGHGYGLRRTALPVTAWPKLVETWLGTIQVLPASSDVEVRLPADVAAVLGKLTPYQKSLMERFYYDWAFLAKYRDADIELPAPAPGEARVVFMGDSITEGWGQHGAAPPPDRAAFFPGKPYINRGISGQTTPQMLVRFRQDVIELKPKAVVLLAGTNDIAENTGKMTLEETEGNIASMSELARANGIRVVLCSVLPASEFHWHKGLEPAPKVKALNAWIKEYAAKNGFVYVDYYSRMANSEGGLGPELSPDGVHPNKAGYEIMAPLAEAGIAQALNDWRDVELPARGLNIAEINGTLWVCGADELIAASADGGNSWAARHRTVNGSLLLTIGFANEQFGYAAGTGGQVLITRDGGNTWESIKAPSEVVYEVAFSDEKHGIIHAPRNIYTTSDGGATWVPVQIDLASEDLKGFSHVLTVVALDANHMAIVLSQGNSSVYAYKLFLTKDGGANWTVSDIPSTVLGNLISHGGEYWFAGVEVIEKDKPGGGHGVPLVMHSADGEKWTHLARWSNHEFSECNSQGCLYWDGAGVQLPPTSPVSFWAFAPEKVVTARWAVARGTICSVGAGLKCAAVTTTQTMPAYLDTSSPIAPPISAPPLDASPSQGLQCLYCDFERIMVTSDFQGVADVQLRLQIGQNGLVGQVEIVRATNSGIGERIAASARNWVFLPFVKDGVVHPTNTEVKLRVQAIESK